jgi:hypothetical protein
MPLVNLYVFKEPRNWKNKPAETVPFFYSAHCDLQSHMLRLLDGDGVYHITAFNAYSQFVCEVFKSKKTRGKVE